MLDRFPGRVFIWRKVLIESDENFTESQKSTENAVMIAVHDGGAQHVTYVVGEEAGSGSPGGHRVACPGEQEKGGPKPATRRGAAKLCA